MALDITAWFSLISGLLCAVPIAVLAYYYSRTSHFDFLLLAGVYFAGMITLLARAVSAEYTAGWLDLLSYSAYHISYFLIFLHSARIKWSKIPKSFNLLVIGLFALFQIMILFSAEISVLLGVSAQLVFDVTIVILTNLYRIGAMFFLILVYSTIEEEMLDQRVRKARILFIIAGTLQLVYPVIKIPTYYSIISISNTLGIYANFGSLLIIAYVIFLYPETTLISKAQIIRVSNLYSKVKTVESPKVKSEFGMKSMVEYLAKLSETLLENDQ